MLCRQAALSGCNQFLCLEVQLAICLHPRPHLIPLAHPHHSGRLHLVHPCPCSLITCWDEPGKRIAFHVGKPETFRGMCVFTGARANTMPCRAAQQRAGAGALRSHGAHQHLQAEGAFPQIRDAAEVGAGQVQASTFRHVHLCSPTAPARATKEASECCRSECLIHL